MVILQQPDILSLSGNIKEFRISTADPISFALRQGAIEIIAQSYTPGKDGIVIINLRDIVHSRLSFTLQESALIYEQPSLAATFTAVISGTEVTFRAIRSGVDRLADTATNFLTQNFLTWQPSTKAVTYYSPEFLTYYAVAACTAQLRAYFTDTSGSVTSQQDITLSAFDAGKAYTIPLQYASVAEKLGNKLPAYYDVWVESPSASRLTYIQRYYASDMLSEQEQWVLFENSLGGIDTFRAYGSTDFTADHTHNIAEIDEVSSEYRVDTARKFQKNTGHLTDKERRWLLDFFPSQSKYIYAGTYLRRIVVAESNVTYTDRELPSAYTFTYKYADARPLLNLPRTDVPSGALNITVPSVGSFTMPPRLVEFPRLPLTEGALFPIQNPYSEEWNTTTAGSLSDFIAERLSQNYGGTGGVGHQHNNIDLLQLLTYATEYLLVAGKKVKAGYADKAGWIDGLDDVFIHRDRPDITNFLLKLLGGAEVGDALDSFLLGKGIILKDGRIQADYIEARRAMKVMELIYNRLSAMEGDFVFTESGSIDSIEALGEDTYQLTMRKRWDADFTAFKEHDICRCIVNDLAQGGVYQTSWMRIISKNAAANQLTVILYPDTEVPAKQNFPPAVGMVMNRWGNTTDEVRQRCWYLSSTDGGLMMLRNVDQPILTDNNYAGSVGLPPRIKALEDVGADFNEFAFYGKNAYFENLVRTDYQGNIIKDSVDRGFWSMEVATSDNPYRTMPTGYDTVWHLGCKWKCLVDKTIDAPRWNSKGWDMTEGNPEFTVEIESTNGFDFDYDNIDTTLFFVGKLHNQDVTNDIHDADIEWTRDSGNVTDDNAWAALHTGIGSQIHITVADVGTNYKKLGYCKFTVKAYLRDGENIQDASDFIIY